MVLLDNVVEVFNLAYKDRHGVAGVDCSMAALLTPLLSIATLYGSPFTPMALSKKHFAGAMSRFAVSKKSMVSSCLSTAR